MPEPEYLTKALSQVYIDRMNRRKEIEMSHYDVNITKNDLLSNIFYFVVLGGACIWLAFF